MPLDDLEDPAEFEEPPPADAAPAESPPAEAPENQPPAVGASSSATSPIPASEAIAGGTFR
jgi:hypothetical protein